MSFQGKTIVITAGGAGIGRAIALGFAREGANVLVSDISQERAEAVAAEIEALGGRAIGLACDVAADADVEALAAATLAHFGPADILVNHAGVAAAGPIAAIPLDDWRWVFDVNVLGIVRGVRAFLPQMTPRGSGWIVNTASNLGLFPEVPLALPYITTKAGVIGMSRALSLALRPLGIGVSVLCPDITDTAFHFTGRMHGFDAAQAAKALPLDKQQPPEAVADALFDALRARRFLATNMPDVDEHLRAAAHTQFEPAFRVYPELGQFFPPKTTSF